MKEKYFFYVALPRTLSVGVLMVGALFTDWWFVPVAMLIHLIVEMSI